MSNDSELLKKLNGLYIKQGAVDAINQKPKTVDIVKMSESNDEIKPATEHAAPVQTITSKLSKYILILYYVLGLN